MVALSFTSFLRVFNMVPMQLKSKSQDSFKQCSNFLMQWRPSLQLLGYPTQIYQMHSNANVRCKFDQAISLQCLHQTPAFPTEVQSFFGQYSGLSCLELPFQLFLVSDTCIESIRRHRDILVQDSITSLQNLHHQHNIPLQYIIFFVEARHY